MKQMKPCEKFCVVAFGYGVTNALAPRLAQVVRGGLMFLECGHVRADYARSVGCWCAREDRSITRV